MGSCSKSGEAVLIGCVMAGGAFMALAIARLVSVKVVELLLAMLR